MAQPNEQLRAALQRFEADPGTGMERAAQLRATIASDAALLPFTWSLSGISKFTLLKRAALVTALSLGCGCASAAHLGAGKAPEPVATEEGCLVVGDTQARELCFSRKPEAEIEECERMRPFACKPYRDMHRLDRELAALTRDLSARAQKRYAAYAEDDAAYLGDLSAYIGASGKAWAASRDADCLLEPFAQGMSRREAGDLTEACRVERTQARIGQIKGLFSSM